MDSSSSHSPGIVAEIVVEKADGWVGAGFQVLLLLGCPGSPDRDANNNDNHDDNNYISGGGDKNEDKYGNDNDYPPQHPHSRFPYNSLA